MCPDPSDLSVATITPRGDAGGLRLMLSEQSTKRWASVSDPGVVPPDIERAYGVEE